MLQIALGSAPALFLGSFSGPGWTSCILWAFAGLMLRVICSPKLIVCAPCIGVYFLMVAAVSAADGLSLTQIYVLTEWLIMKSDSLQPSAALGLNHKIFLFLKKCFMRLTILCPFCFHYFLYPSFSAVFWTMRHP
jgi:hypothetical protein